MPQIHAEYQEVSRAEWERRTRTWELAFCLLPHKCIETGKWLWLEFAYRGYKPQRYDWQVIDTYNWMCKEEFIVLRLMDKI